MARHVLFLTALLVIVTDQFTKFWIKTNLAVGQSIPETGFIRLTHVRNTGAAFGLFQDHSFLLAVVSIAGVAFILAYVFFMYRRFPFLDGWLGKVAFGLILGGTVGNLIDRLRFGYVTDFIDISIWPAFNVADSSVVVGVFMFVYSLYSLAQARKRPDE